MGALSAQALALLCMLAPACVFFLSFTYSKGAVKPEFQRGVLMDTALFVLAASALHLYVGGLFLLALEASFSCRVLGSIAHLASVRATSVPPTNQCSAEFGFIAGWVYLNLVTAAAALVGRIGFHIVNNNPNLFRALYGPFHEPALKGKGTYVVANVLTDVEEAGRYLMYEGKLDEISISGDKTINYVCLLSPLRFHLEFKKGGTVTLDRSKFVAIDRNTTTPSRLVIPGDQIKNFLTRTYVLGNIPVDTENADAATHTSASETHLLYRLWAALQRWSARKTASSQSRE
jgi:hypothetical protein